MGLTTRKNFEAEWLVFSQHWLGAIESDAAA